VRLIEPAREETAGIRSDRQSAIYVGLLGPAAGFEQEFESADEEPDAPAESPLDVRLLKFASPLELPTTAAALDALDVLVMPDGALLVSDDAAGAVYRISYKK